MHRRRSFSSSLYDGTCAESSNSRPHRSLSSERTPIDDLPSLRQSNLDDIGASVPEIDVNLFMDHLLPPLRSGIDVNQVLSESGGNKLVGAWKNIFYAPSQSSEHERRVFAIIENLVQAICKSASLSHIEPTINFVQSPDTGLRSDSGITKPDAYGIIPSPKGHKTLTWSHVAFAGQYKKKKESSILDTNNNISQICWSLATMMQDNICRRFAFGFTIHDTLFRMWYCNRSHIVVSAPFDFRTERRVFTRFFLSLLYAPSLAHLGWDPTMKPRLVGGCDIQVSDDHRVRTFRTLKQIYDYGNMTLLGRGTRVWIVRELNNKGEPVGELHVLKDVWIDSDRVREGDILAQINNAAKAAKYLPLRECLPTVICCGDVYVNDVADTTDIGKAFGPDMKMLELQQKTKEDGLRFLTAADRAGFPKEMFTDDKGSTASTSKDRLYGSKAIVEYHTKTHYRLVTAHVGTSLSAIISVKTVARILTQACRALCHVHELGWVHRDISVDNILIVNDRAQIVDWEYAVHENRQGPCHKIRTASHRFMAAEAFHNSYLFTSRPRPETLVDGDSNLEPWHTSSYAPNEKTLELFKADSAHNLESFRHNPFHDVESIWRVAVYCIVVKISSRKWKSYSKMRQADAEMDSLLLTGDMQFRRLLQILHTTLRPVGVALDSARLYLCRLYETAESQAEITFKTLQVERSNFGKYLQIIEALAPDADKPVLSIKLDDLDKSPGSGITSKRPMEEITNKLSRPVAISATGSSTSGATSSISNRTDLKLDAIAKKKGKVNDSKPPNAALWPEPAMAEEATRGRRREAADSMPSFINSVAKKKRL